ncbi:MAG: hypothetical protein CYPHOPRED_000791 [Cyphobasidiales sp. Tagirdzhanova-0007]|nr:MAG: hypothetical protein CYPHOPRED_000791 [Cyphobasidiales sp. Tagirdzhanova-0007]
MAAVQEASSRSSSPPLGRRVDVGRLLPDSLRNAVQNSMQNCQEYERKCALLQHSIEHKILIWSDILDKYETQDSTATQLRDSIASSLSTLQSAKSTIESASSSTSTASGKLDRSQTLLESASDSIQASRDVMRRLDAFMRHEEITAKKVERLQRGLLGTVTGVVLLIAILITWLYS